MCLWLFAYKKWTRYGLSSIYKFYLLFFRPHGGILRLFDTSQPQTKLSSDGKINQSNYRFGFKNVLKMCQYGLCLGVYNEMCCF